ncbi:hypothetical protein [Anaerocolumna chitinilytica]|uniref:Uncharacterized protein n=1 Tax=Anaerocolumna chitinilytica TaxID=1727145 RepID=A0A7M3SAT9_9FIRM|nr:hypothetical protein [Anaerocolumna chitinilytica]BCK01707.1 hypothetical protein bsdcttw_47470 [Anaerocolumna chitinilytica]
MEGFYNKHYIRLDTNNCIIKGFSDAFEQPEENDNCINQEGGRHFELLGQVNPSLISLSGVHLYKYSNGVIVETTEAERAAELAAMPKTVSEIDTQTEYLIDLDYRISKIELGV